MTHLRLHPRPITLVAIVASMVAGISLGIAAHHHKQRAATKAPADLSTFAALLEQVRDNYVEPRDEATLLGDAIAGMMRGLDPHSTYLAGDALTDLAEHTDGRFGGIGVELAYERDRIAVLAPIDGSPAAAAGIVAGDVLLRIEGTPIGDVTIEDVVPRLRGAPGSMLTLTLERRERNPPEFDVNLVRAIVNVASVRSRLLDDGFGYVRISQFQNNTGAELVAALHALESQQGRLPGLVLDLRNNPGGVLQASVDVVDAFLTKGLIVYTKGRQPSADLRFTASSGDVLDGAPLAVLINRGSASASEIVAGALQDHKRAKVLGGPSYGKGTVQAVIFVDDEHALKLTTARYYTPNGRSIQADGIHPDVEVKEGEGEDLVLARAIEELKRG
jgi:carboxyl-terminal processing protease